MPSERFKLTNASVEKRCAPPPPDEIGTTGKTRRQRLYFDSEVRGFGVLVTRNDRSGKHTRTFIVQRNVMGHTRRVTIGHFGDLSAEEARKRALENIATMLKGIDPNAQKRLARSRGITLKEAADNYRVKPVKLTKRPKAKLTLGNHDRFLKALKNWENRPLAEISRDDVLKRHQKLTATVGPVAANNTLRWFRAVYNSAMIVHEMLPANPTIALTGYWNDEDRTRSPMTWEQLSQWSLWVDGDLRKRNPVRADLLLFILFSGLRSTDAKTMKWLDVNFQSKALHRPSPKGGEKKAFDIPLSPFQVGLLERRMKENAAVYGDKCPWVFPTFDRHGNPSHVAELKEAGRPSPHRLRDTYATAAHEAGIALLDIKVLLNHALPKRDVTEGYIRPTLEHLRLQQVRISEFLLNHML